MDCYGGKHVKEQCAFGNQGVKTQNSREKCQRFTEKIDRKALFQMDICKVLRDIVLEDKNAWNLKKAYSY